MNPKKLVAWFLAAALVACGGSDGDPTPAPTPPLPEGQNITIVGKVVAPDLSTPIANVVVYVEGALPATSGTGQAVGSLACGSTPDPTWAGSCSAADGTFTLSIVTPANAKLAVSKGAFRSTRTLKGYPKNGQFDAGLVSIAAGIGVDGEAPRMAVVTGAYDSIEDVLAKLGFGELENGRLKRGTERFTIFEGGSSSTGSDANASALFEDRDGSGRIDLFDYAIVFINCGASGMQTLIENAAVRQAVRAYAEGGGRLYVSDQAYDVVEQSFPEFIDFLGSNNTPAATAETVFAATEGAGGITVEAQVAPGLQAWLQGVTCAGGPCVQASGRVHIEGFLGGWAVMNGAHTGASVTTLVSGAVTFNGGTNVVKPLTMSFAVGSGRVTYTSYHNEAELGDALRPQQRILQYLVFEL